MTRWPASGRCKRRLAQTLGASPAARIQSRLIAHTLTVAQNVAAQHRLPLHVAVSGAGPRARQRWLASLPQARVIGQGHGGLGNRMRREVLRAKTVHPGSPVILIGTDLPDLEERDLAQAIEALKHALWCWAHRKLGATGCSAWMSQALVHPAGPSTPCHGGPTGCVMSPANALGVTAWSRQSSLHAMTSTS